MGINHIFKRNNRRSLPIFVFLAFVSTVVNIGYAQESFQVKTEKNFLWSIKTNENAVYFLGSLHVLKSDSYPLSEEIESAYSKSTKIVFETDLDGMNDPAQLAKMMTLGLYMDGQTLEQNLSEQTYKLLKAKVAAAGLTATQFDLFKPWFCALTLTAIELQRLGFDPTYGIDMHFFNKAKKDKKEIIFLEPVEYQLNLFANLGKRGQESLLLQTLKDLDVMGEMASDMVTSWKTGDVNKLNSIMKISFKEHPDTYDRIVIQRNKKWVSQIENLIRQNDNVLVIVGAGHLVGAESILDLLRQKGYKTEQR
jgi:uncharacterized protein YbaP (TraB family)